MKIEAEFDLQTGTAIEADFEIKACVPVSEAEHNDLQGRDVDDAHPISAITDLQDSLDGLETDIESEATTRASADTTLQTNINTEASARQAADTTLTNNLNTEISTRENADTVLATAISEKQDKLPTMVSGKFLTNDGTNLSWETVDALPSQTGNSGKQLTTNGTTASWSNTILLREWNNT